MSSVNTPGSDSMVHHQLNIFKMNLIFIIQSILRQNICFRMKGSKVSSAFTTKFSSYLSKFKESSTINIAHDQIRKLFSQYKYTDIALAFLGKMDSCDQLNEKQKKQHSKVYLTLIDVYGQDIVLEHYERMIQSLVKKTVGVSEVVGHLCQTLLNRIYPVENISNYIRHLLVMFKQHIQISKVVKQIMESFDAEFTEQFQAQMLGLISQRIHHQKTKVQSLQAILSIILSLQNKFNCDNITQGLLAKYFKNDDWNTRKLCVDISYALLVIRQEANELLHHNIKQMKYDKIRHVRQAVTNYYVLYKQIYGDQKTKNEPVSEKKFHSKIGASKSPTFRKTIPNPIESRSLDKNMKKSRNEQFFQNAKNKDVIKLPEENKSLILPKEKLLPTKAKWEQDLPPSINSSREKRQPKNQEKNLNFQNYLKNRSPRTQYFNLMPEEKPTNETDAKNDEKELTTFRRKKQQQSEIQFQSPLADSSLSLIEQSNQNIRVQILALKESFSNFQIKVMAKLAAVQDRVRDLEKKAEDTTIKTKYGGYIEESFDNRYSKYNKVNESSELSVQAESNLEQKVRQSINKNNWDEAFSLVLANNKKNLLMQLLTHCKIPSDKLVIDCLFMEVRKELKSWISLKWLLHLVQETDISVEKLKKLKKELERTNPNLLQDSESRNYLMLKNLLLNEIDQKLQNI